MQTETTKKLFTVDEYYKMVETGIISRQPRTELVGGEIIEMSSMGVRHRAAVIRITTLLTGAMKDKAQVAVQIPLTLNAFNEPEPDITLLKPRRDFYLKTHARPSDVFLVLEIADTSLPYDRDVKLPLYAASRIVEVWILDLKHSTLTVYRDPAGGRFKSAVTLARGDSVTLLAVPDIPLSVEDLLGA